VSDYTPQQAITKLEEIDREIRSLDARESLSDGQQEHRSRLDREFRRLSDEVEQHRERARRREQVGRKPHSRVHELPTASMVPALEGAQDRALRNLDGVSDSFQGAGAIDTQDALIRRDPIYAADFEARSRPEYASAFNKILRVGSIGDAAVFMDDAERQSMANMWQTRAMAEGVTTQGGMAVPVVIDPSVILTDQENVNPFLSTARVVDVVGSNVWKGVSAAGATWSFDLEGAEVSDDSITLAQPTVSVYMARGFIPFSIEVSEDWSGFQAEMTRVLSAGWNDLLLQKLTLGSGTNEPMGLVTSLDATATSEVQVTTAGALGSVDLYNAWQQLPAKYHQGASWMASVGAENEIRKLGQYTSSHSFTVDLTAGSVDVLFGKQLYENAYMSSTITTGHYNWAVVGDLQNYVVARRTGLTAELVPHLIGTTSGRPTGSRGLFCYARVGGNVVNSAGLRLINQT
jgi:HK97 family phage major capsid protein